MAPQLLFDLTRFDLERLLYDTEQIESVNPQRGHMRQLDGIIHMDFDEAIILGYKDIGKDEFWVPGHIPGRPLYPGVMMIEAAAQLSAFLMKMHSPHLGFLGFVGCDEVKFRGQVIPGDRFYLLGKELKRNRRRFICNTQGVVNGNLVFEAKVQGMPI